MLEGAQKRASVNGAYLSDPSLSCRAFACVCPLGAKRRRLLGRVGVSVVAASSKLEPYISASGGKKGAKRGKRLK